MAVSLKTQKMLWGRRAARCAMPNCRLRLVETVSETDDSSLVGENCHIVADSDIGLRADPAMALDLRSRYDNLILLCSVDHTITDDNEKVWTVDRLRKLKNDHEQWVERSLGIDIGRLRDDAVYADYVEQWAKLAHLDSWTGWSSFVLGSGQPRLRVEVDKDLGQLRTWLIGRIWPGRYPPLEAAFLNFMGVLHDFQETFRSELERSSDTMLTTKKFYQIPEWDPQRYERLGRLYDFHVALVCDLMFELTRAANLLCDQVRQHLSPSYRLAEGYLIVSHGPDETFRWSKFPPRYLLGEATESTTYKGLADFYDDRSKRDCHVGTGKPPR